MVQKLDAAQWGLDTNYRVFSDGQEPPSYAPIEIIPDRDFDDAAKLLGIGPLDDECLRQQEQETPPLTPQQLAHRNSMPYRADVEYVHLAGNHLAVSLGGGGGLGSS